MYILGLTGSIAMGKSFAAREFSRLHIPVFDADKVVHQLLGKNGKAVQRVAALFPDTFKDGEIDKKRLSDAVFTNKRLLASLESVIHPLVEREQQIFLARAHLHRKKMAVLDIPLLLEKGYDAQCDAVLLVSASLLMQQYRVLERENMTLPKFLAIRRLQMPELKKRERVHFIINTGLGKGFTRRKIQQLVKEIQGGGCRQNHAGS